MTKLTNDQVRTYYKGDFKNAPLAAGVVVYNGAAVGGDAQGYARPLIAGDVFLGFSDQHADNLTGTQGADAVRIRTNGTILLPIPNLTLSDVGKHVYASDDGTFTLDDQGNSKIGTVSCFTQAGTGIVKFDV